MNLLLTVVVCLVSFVSISVARPLLLDGGYWQPNHGKGMFLGLSDDELAAEVENFKALGLRTILVQYAGHWDKQSQGYRAYWRNDILPMADGYEGRDPLGAILRAAEKQGVKVVIGSLLTPKPRYEEFKRNHQRWLSKDAVAYRVDLLKRYGAHPAVVGWYVSNEYSPQLMMDHEADPRVAIEAIQQELALVREHAPRLKIIHPIGLYLVTTPEGHHWPADISFLDRFWRPWISQLSQVDAWLMIDGLGTTLSNPEHSNKAQAWLAGLCREYRKEMWTQVEAAEMGKSYLPFTMERLEKSLKIASRHADVLSAFDYLHYMNSRSPRAEARKLHADYRDYRERELSKQSKPE